MGVIPAPAPAVSASKYRRSSPEQSRRKKFKDTRGRPRALELPTARKPSLVRPAASVTNHTRPKTTTNRQPKQAPSPPRRPPVPPTGSPTNQAAARTIDDSPADTCTYPGERSGDGQGGGPAAGGEGPRDRLVLGGRRCCCCCRCWARRSSSSKSNLLQASGPGAGICCRISPVSGGNQPDACATGTGTTPRSPNGSREGGMCRRPARI